MSNNLVFYDYIYYMYAINNLLSKIEFFLFKSHYNQKIINSRIKPP